MGVGPGVVPGAADGGGAAVAMLVAGATVAAEAGTAEVGAAVAGTAEVGAAVAGATLPGAAGVVGVAVGARVRAGELPTHPVETAAMTSSARAVDCVREPI